MQEKSSVQVYGYSHITRDRHDTLHILRHFPLPLTKGSNGPNGPNGTNEGIDQILDKEGLLIRLVTLHLKNIPEKVTTNDIAESIIKLCDELPFQVLTRDPNREHKKRAKIRIGIRGAERIVHIAQEGQLKISTRTNVDGESLPDDPIAAWIPEIHQKQANAGIILFCASELVLANSSAAFTAIKSAETLRLFPLPVVFDFRRKKVIFTFLRFHFPMCLSVVFRAELPFQCVAREGIWLWNESLHDEDDDLRVSIRFWRPPCVKYWILGIPPGALDHERTYRHLLSHVDSWDGMEFSPKGTTWLPLHNADLMVFKFSGRRDIIFKSDLVRKLRQCELMSNSPNPLSRPWTIEHPQSLRTHGFPTQDSQSWLTLPADVRWRLYGLLTHGIISVRALDMGLVESIQRHLQRTQLSIVCGVLEVMFREGWDEDSATYCRRIMDNQVKKVYRDLLLESHKFKSKVKTFADIREETVMIPSVVIMPGKMLCLGPFEQISNRTLREYKDLARQGFFLRVRFASGNYSQIHLDESHYAGYIQDVLRNGLNIYGDKYLFLMYSASQLRQGSCWFISENSPVSPDDIRKWMGGTMNNIRSPGKFAARLGQALSTTRQASEIIPNHEYKFIPDIYSKNKKYIFTDGCGLISSQFAREVSERTAVARGKERYTPSAFQIRFRGCKGMVVVDPTLKCKMALRDSMNKLETNPTPLEICENSSFRRLTLNREVILLLNSRGVPDKVFMRLQNDFVANMKEVEVNKEQAVSYLRTFSSTLFMRDTATCLRTGFELSEPFIRRSLRDLLRHTMAKLVKKSMIPIDEGANLFGVSDPYGVLKEGEVVVQVNPFPHDCKYPIIGPVAVTRNPCHHPGDVRRLKAVAPPPQLRHLEDVIVFSIKGNRPPANMMSGGDLDGDQFSVIWNPNLIPPAPHTPLDYPSQPAEDIGRPIEVGDLHEFFVNFQQNSNLGIIAHSHMAQADSLGVFSDVCQELALLASKAVDFPKTGVPAIVPKELIPDTWPDFMEKSASDSYESPKVLGQLYRAAVRISDHYSHYLDDTGFRIDLMINGHDKYLDEARSLYSRYCHTIRGLMLRYHIDSETKFFTAAIPLEKSFDANIDTDFRKHAEEASTRLKNEFRTLFFAPFENSGHVYSLTKPFSDAMLKKASAWYTVTANAAQAARSSGRRDRVLITFPWVVPDVLAGLSAHVIQQKRIEDRTVIDLSAPSRKPSRALEAINESTRYMERMRKQRNSRNGISLAQHIAAPLGTVDTVPAPNGLEVELPEAPHTAPLTDRTERRNSLITADVIMPKWKSEENLHRYSPPHRKVSLSHSVSFPNDKSSIRTLLRPLAALNAMCPSIKKENAVLKNGNTLSSVVDVVELDDLVDDLDLNSAAKDIVYISDDDLETWRRGDSESDSDGLEVVQANVGWPSEGKKRRLVGMNEVVKRRRGNVITIDLTGE